MHEKFSPFLELWVHVKLWASLFATWLFGTSGQVALAGAAGGAVRWWMSERKRLLSGLGSVITGAIFAQYFAPITLVVLTKYIGPLGEGAFATAAFSAGLVGMSIAKIIIAAVDAAAGKMGGNHDKD